MKQIIFILFLLPLLVYSQNEGKAYPKRISEEDKKEFYDFKNQVIHSLQKNVIREAGFDRFNAIVGKNRDLLTKNSIQVLLEEFLISEEFHRLSLDAVTEKPSILYGLTAFLIFAGLKNFYLMDHFLGGSLNNYDGFFSLVTTGTSIVVSAGVTMAMGVLITEEVANHLVVSKFRLLKDPRPNILLRTVSTCKRMFSDWNSGKNL